MKEGNVHALTNFVCWQRTARCTVCFQLLFPAALLSGFGSLNQYTRHPHPPTPTQHTAAHTRAQTQIHTGPTLIMSCSSASSWFTRGRAAGSSAQQRWMSEASRGGVSCGSMGRSLLMATATMICSRHVTITDSRCRKVTHGHLQQPLETCQLSSVTCWRGRVVDSPAANRAMETRMAEKLYTGLMLLARGPGSRHRTLRAMHSSKSLPLPLLPDP